jgi:hypothetical protein
MQSGVHLRLARRRMRRHALPEFYTAHFGNKPENDVVGSHLEIGDSAVLPRETLRRAVGSRQALLQLFGGETTSKTLSTPKAWQNLFLFPGFRFMATAIRSGSKRRSREDSHSRPPNVTSKAPWSLGRSRRFGGVTVACDITSIKGMLIREICVAKTSGCVCPVYNSTISWNVRGNQLS